MGQLYEIATVFYKLDNLNVHILESRNDNVGSTSVPLAQDAKTVMVKYRLDFDNRDYVSVRNWNKTQFLRTHRKYLFIEDVIGGGGRKACQSVLLYIKRVWFQ